jgi:hypothetical protein
VHTGHTRVAVAREEQERPPPACTSEGENS